MKTPFPVVEIVWLDAHTGADGWEETDLTREVEAAEVMTIGFLIKESPNGVLVASTACNDKMTNARITIPRGMVKTIRYLRGGPKLKIRAKSVQPRPESEPNSSQPPNGTHHQFIEL